MTGGDGPHGTSVRDAFRLRLVEKAQREIALTLDRVEHAALMVDVGLDGFPVAAASRGFQQLTGLSSHDVCGRALTEVIVNGAPAAAVSKSAGKNVNDFCQICSSAETQEISDITVVQPRANADGSHSTVLYFFGHCEVRRKPYVLVLQEPLGDGLLVRVTEQMKSEMAEKCRKAFMAIRRGISKKEFLSNASSFVSTNGCGGSDSEAESPLNPWGRNLARTRRQHRCTFGHRRESMHDRPEQSVPSFGFFRDRMQDHCILSNDGFTATRREMKELQSGCLVFSDRPVGRSLTGLQFSLRVDTVAEAFVGFPLLGFTRRRPSDRPDLYPLVATCLGESLLIGRGCKAYARDRPGHFKMGFRLPPQDEVQTFLPPQDAPNLSEQLCVGQVVTCMYMWQGRLQFWLDEEKILDFDTGRPIEEGVEYYAAVDVCLGAGSLTLLPSESTADLDDDDIDSPWGSEVEDLDDAISKMELPRGPASGSLFTDVKAPLAPLMSVGDLSSIDLGQDLKLRQTTCSNGSSRSASLASVSSGSLPALSERASQGGDEEHQKPGAPSLMLEVEEASDEEDNYFSKSGARPLVVEAGEAAKEDEDLKLGAAWANLWPKDFCREASFEECFIAVPSPLQAKKHVADLPRPGISPEKTLPDGPAQPSRWLVAGLLCAVSVSVIAGVRRSLS